MSRDPSESSRFDRFVAIAAGPANWQHGRQPTSVDLGAGCLELAALGAILTVTLTAARDRDLGPGWVPFALVVAMGAILLLVAGPTGLWVFGRSERRRPTRFGDLRLAAAGRTFGFAVVAGLWAVVIGGVHLEDAWMFGVVVGSEITLGARTIGAAIRPWRWWRDYLFSLGHLAAIAFAVIVGVIAGGREGVRLGIAVYVAVQFAALVVATHCWSLERVRHRFETEVREHAMAIERGQHRRRAHWLHDDVCSELRLLRLQLETQHLAPTEIAEQLDELDHRLRVRQLDELLQSGRVRLAEIIQPFVRRAQAHGLRMRSVPRFEQASLELDEHTGRMVQRAAAVLMTNAIQAGATELAIHAVVDEQSGRLELRFEDDAGGFDHFAIPPGRGIDSLRHDLGPGSLELRRTAGGTSARVVFLLETPQEAR